MNSTPASVAIEKARVYLDSPMGAPFFLCVDSAASYRAALDAFSTLERVRASRFCKTADSPCDYDGLLQHLRSSPGQPRLLVGVGEALALGAEYRHSRILGRLANDHSLGKLVVLWRGAGMRNALFDKHRADPRFNDARMSVAEGELDYAVVRVDPKLAVPACNGVQALLRGLEEGASGTLYVQTGVSIHAARTLQSEYDALVEHDPRFLVPREALPDELWGEYGRNPSLEGHDPFHWRTYLGNRLVPPHDPYVALALEKSSSHKEYIQRLEDLLLDVAPHSDGFWELYEARKRLLGNAGWSPTSRYMALGAVK